MIRRTFVPLTAASVALLLTAGPASAVVNADVTGGTILNIGSIAGADPIVVTCAAGNVRVNGDPPTSPLACGSATAITIGAGDLDDRVDLRGVTAAQFGGLTAVTVNGDDGQDTLIAARGVINGGAGNDRIIQPQLGVIDGGAGTDSIEFDYLDAADVAVDFNIGATSYTAGGQPAQTANNVEQYVLSMPDKANNVSNVNSTAYAGRVVARLHAGADTFNGGPGNDFVDAGPGNDSLNPGAGNDSVQGGEGADTIFTQDGEVDTIDCGNDPNAIDTVTADRGDIVKNCETVNLPPLPPPAPTPAPETSSVIGLKKVPQGAKASFLFVSPTAGATFECRIDKKSWRSCSSPFKLNTKRQSRGKHKIYVRAVLSGGNVDASPSKFGFRVVKRKR